VGFLLQDDRRSIKRTEIKMIGPGKKDPGRFFFNRSVGCLSITGIFSTNNTEIKIQKKEAVSKV
jgi:hypothetical protein